VDIEMGGNAGKDKFLRIVAIPLAEYILVVSRKHRYATRTAPFAMSFLYDYLQVASENIYLNILNPE
jgi:hypothetical protein